MGNNYTYEKICEIFEDYYKENGSYPNSIICNKANYLPNWKTVKNICKDDYKQFCKRFNIKTPFNKNDYNYYCQQVLELSKILGRTPTVYDIADSPSELEIPEYRWLVKNCPDKNVTNYSEFLTYIGLKPIYFVSKEMATELIYKKQSELGRGLKISDFESVDKNEIGRTTIKRIWGTFNNMLLDLGLPINQEYMSSKNKSIDELKKDIVLLCNSIYEKENRDIISSDDIDKSEFCLSPQTYNKHFKEKLGLTLSQFINSIGFKSNQVGMGMNYTFDNGEITTSKYEYDMSNFLRNKKIKYSRNVKYKTFINSYNQEMDCDYVIQINGSIWYIEIAGMLRDYSSIEHARQSKLSKIHSRYLEKLELKEKLLKDSKVNYKILFAKDFSNLQGLFNEILYSSKQAI